MLPRQILPGQMSSWQLESVLNVHRNLLLKFHQNWVSNSWDIADFEFLWVVGGWVVVVVLSHFHVNNNINIDKNNNQLRYQPSVASGRPLTACYAMLPSEFKITATPPHLPKWLGWDLFIIIYFFNLTQQKICWSFSRRIAIYLWDG